MFGKSALNTIRNCSTKSTTFMCELSEFNILHYFDNK